MSILFVITDPISILSFEFSHKYTKLVMLSFFVLLCSEG